MGRKPKPSHLTVLPARHSRLQPLRPSIRLPTTNTTDPSDPSATNSPAPSHRALAIARSEGYKAKMLPGVLAEDYMFADLEFDPAIHGCCAYEATHLLLKNIPLDTSINNVIWQVGGVGMSMLDFERSLVT